MYRTDYSSGDTDFSPLFQKQGSKMRRWCESSHSVKTCDFPRDAVTSPAVMSYIVQLVISQYRTDSVVSSCKVTSAIKRFGPFLSPRDLLGKSQHGKSTKKDVNKAPADPKGA